MHSTHYNPLNGFDCHPHPFTHKDHDKYPHLDCTECMSDSVLLLEEFTNITVGKWGRICEQVLKRVNIQVIGDSGQASAKGITLAWNYDETNLKLTLKLVHRSWYDPSIDSIDTQIKAWVNAA